MTLKSTIGPKKQKKIKPIWEDRELYVTTKISGKLFHFHFDKVAKNLRDNLQPSN